MSGSLYVSRCRDTSRLAADRGHRCKQRHPEIHGDSGPLRDISGWHDNVRLVACVHGDIDCDADVDFPDFSVLAANFTGTMNTPPPPSSSNLRDVDSKTEVAGANAIGSPHQRPSVVSEDPDVLSLLALTRPLGLRHAPTVKFSDQSTASRMSNVAGPTTALRLSLNTNQFEEPDEQLESPLWQILAHSHLTSVDGRA